MSNYNSLKATIDANIKQNGNQEITGQILNSVLNQMVTTLGAGYQFAGVATLDPATNPGTPDAKVFYIANGKGTYTNFGGLEVTEDEVVVLYWDSSWHKVSTGIASNEKLTELEEKVNGKQDALTLTVKDNGNIVLANIQGQSKEFMPATPSGDPMHYAYVTAGAEYNDTGADIVKTAPWADMIDDDYAGEYGKTVVHKAGYWYLNGLGDITNDEIRKIYIASSNFPTSSDLKSYFAYVDFRTNFAGIRYLGGHTNLALAGMADGSQKFSILNLNCLKGANISAVYALGSIVHILGTEIYFSSTNSLVQSQNLVTAPFKKLKFNLNAAQIPLLSMKSVLCMINNEAATSDITITLHNTVYNRCMSNADILAALQAHTHISLASA